MSAFDRLASIDRLKGGGIGDGEARAHASALDTALRDGVATRSDLDNLGVVLRSDMVDLGRDLRSEMADLGRDLRSDVADVKRDLREMRVMLDAKIDTAAATSKVEIRRWLLVTQVALGGFTFAMLKFLH